MEGFELHEEFIAYCDLVGYDLNEIPTDQLREMKRAFFGGLGRMHRLIEKVSEIPNEKTVIEVINDLEDQINIFWLDEARAAPECNLKPTYMNQPHYQVRTGKKYRVHFALLAPNNEAVGTCKAVATREELDALISETQICSQDMKNFERCISDKGQPYFRLWNADRSRMLIKSEMYTGTDGRENGIDAVIKYAPTTMIIERQ
jgi:uncharacterized protein YegP (UPF0339 family)